MIRSLIRIQELIFVLSLTALACLPIALSKLVRDAGVSLLLPLTVFGAILAWALATWNVRKSLSGFILLILGPLALYIRIGQLGNSLVEFIGRLFVLIPASFNRSFYKIPLETSYLISSKDELAQRMLAFSGRLSLWFAGLIHGTQIEDPVVRTLVWSMVLWLIAVWAGWQICRNKKFLLGMLPSTIVLSFVLEYSDKEKQILWFHLALLLFLYGLTNYHNLQRHWDASRIDYAESTGFDTLVLVGVITIGLVSASFIVSTFSIGDFFDSFRERRSGSNESRAGSLGLESVKNNFRVMGFENGLPRSYLLSAGPQLSTQLAMTISTGDLPPMPVNAHPAVPRYFWRTLTYAIYIGSGWTNPAVSAEDISAGQSLIEVPSSRHRVIHTKVTFPTNAGERLYWPGTLVRADIPFKAAWLHEAENNSFPDADLLAAFAAVKSYQAESILLDVSAQELRDSPGVYPDWVRNQFLALPDSVPERVLALARDLTASEPTAYDRALAIQNYLRKFPYTLNIPAPPAGRDVADYFLFDLKRGYCDYYATSMAVLARAAGLPARLVVGYANGTYDIERAQYIVTENYAHSWVEIYFANIGWVEFEPTASQPQILFDEKKGSTTRIAETRPVERSLQEQISFFFQRSFKNAWLPVIFIFVCGFLWIRFDSLRLTQIESSHAIQLLYKRLRRLARPLAGYTSKHQTAHSYAFTLHQRLSKFEASARLKKWLMPSHHEIDQLTELFSHSLFALLPPTRAEANDAIRIWSRLRWRLILANILAVKNAGIRRS